MNTFKKHQLVALKNLICKRAAETRQVRNEARLLSGMDKWAKQREASGPRELLVAYAFLRGVPYRAIEFSTHYDNRLHPSYIASVIGGLMDSGEALAFIGSGCAPTEAEVKTWLEVPATDAMVEARKKAAEVWKAQKAERTAMHKTTKVA